MQVTQDRLGWQKKWRSSVSWTDRYYSWKKIEKGDKSNLQDNVGITSTQDCPKVSIMSDRKMCISALGVAPSKLGRLWKLKNSATLVDIQGKSNLEGFGKSWSMTTIAASRGVWRPTCCSNRVFRKSMGQLASLKGCSSHPGDNTAMAEDVFRRAFVVPLNT